MRAQLRSALTTTHSPGFSSLPSWATTSRRHSTNTESQCSHSHRQADSHMQAHDDTHILSLSSIHETKRQNRIICPTCACERVEGSADLLPRDLSFSSCGLKNHFPILRKPLFIRDLQHEEEKDIRPNRSNETNSPKARSPKTVCSSADVRLSFQETSLSCSQWRRWSVDTCWRLLLLTRRLVGQAQAGTVVVLGTVEAQSVLESESCWCACEQGKSLKSLCNNSL